MRRRDRRAALVGTAYLLHFERPLKHARHYRGFVAGTSGESLAQRLAQHASGHGARLCAVIHAHGIGFELARTWPRVSRRFERALKHRATGDLCPICAANASRAGVNDL